MFVLMPYVDIYVFHCSIDLISSAKDLLKLCNFCVLYSHDENTCIL